MTKKASIKSQDSVYSNFIWEIGRKGGLLLLAFSKTPDSSQLSDYVTFGFLPSSDREGNQS
jgi:hypothetical protein